VKKTAPLLLSGVDNGTATLESQKGALAVLAERVKTARPQIDSRWFSPEQIPRQHAVLDGTLEFLQTTVQAGNVSHSSLMEYAGKMGPMMAQNAWDAGCLQIIATHSQMMRWKDQLSHDDWNSLVDLNKGAVSKCCDSIFSLALQ
jgi:hypothetical protein